MWLIVCRFGMIKLLHYYCIVQCIFYSHPVTLIVYRRVGVCSLLYRVHVALKLYMTHVLKLTDILIVKQDFMTYLSIIRDNKKKMSGWYIVL